MDRYNQQFAKKDAKQVYRFDSTIISLSAKLFAAGMNYSGIKGNPKNKLHLKVSIGQRGEIPSSVKFYTDQAAASEDVALKRAIRESTIESGDCVVFDRGLTSGKTFVEFCEGNITFITRVDPKRKITILKTMEKAEDEKMARKSETLTILSDQEVQLWDSHNKKIFNTRFRLIRARSLKTNEDLCFLTNDFTTDAIDITELYARRWDIEVFFRFIKQELNFKHFLSRSLNGLKNYLYMVLIFSILLLIYKTSNNRPGYKIVKMYFVGELENEVIAEIVKYCGGDPQKFRDTYCPETNEVSYV